MKQLVLFLFLFILGGCQSDYSSFHAEKNNYASQLESHKMALEEFDFSDLKTLFGITLHPTPDLDWLDAMVKKIEQSQDRVWVEVYIFTEKRLQKALIDAHKRGVDVKIILEKNVYKAPSLNKKTFQNFEKNGIDVVWSDWEDYSLNHTKMMIVDDEFLLSTGNYSYSTFKTNREFFISGKDSEMLAVLEEIFQQDFAKNKFPIYHPNLVLSPFSSREKMEYLIKNARRNLKIYTLNFGDEKMKQLILEKQKSGVQVEMIFPDLKKVGSNKDEIKMFTKAGVRIKQISKPEAHAKAILADEKYLYLGSINFSAPSMDQNREIGLIIKNKEIIQSFLEVFQKDF